MIDFRLTQKGDLDRQSQRLSEYCAKKGMLVSDLIRNINDTCLLSNEQWKEHPFHKGYYASNIGRIKYFDRQKNIEKIKIQYFDKRHNRLRLLIWFDGKQHALDSARFILECFNGINHNLFVDHINSVPYDNTITNLRYVDRKTNNNNPNSKAKQTHSKTTSAFVKIKQVDIESNNVIKIWERAYSIEKELHLPKNSHKNILTVCNGRQKTAYGYKWEYAVDEDLEGEIWKKHPILELECSNKGRVRWFKRNNIYYTTYGGKHTCGYLMVEYKRKKYLVHRLIAETFLENHQNKPQVNHIDTDIYNNKIENLEYCTQQENMLSENTHSKLSTKLMITYNGQTKYYRSIRECARQEHLDRTALRKCLKGELQNYRGMLIQKC